MDPAEDIPEIPASEEIVVEGYSPRYTAAVKDVLGIEGGYVNDKADRGGATQFGISLRFLAGEGTFDEDGDGKADFDLDMDGDIDGQDIRLLTPGDAVQLYHRCFWQRLDAEIIPAPIGEMMFDQAVNGGLAAARKLLQRAINTCVMRAPSHPFDPVLLKVDGAIGPMTKARMHWVIRHPALGLDVLAETFRDAVRERYRAIVRRNPSQERFLRGWLNRADRLGRPSTSSGQSA